MNPTPKQAAVVGVSAAVALSLVALGLGDAEFDAIYLGGLSATLAGLAASVPVALMLLSQQQRHERNVAAEADAENERLRRAEEERSEQLRRAAEERSKRDVLLAIKGELAGNLTDLAGRQPTGAREVMLPALSVEVWRAVSASGDLQAVRDPVLLGRIARAYRFLGQTRQIEEVLLPEVLIGKIVPTGALLATDGITKAAMDEAVHAIDAELARLPED